MSEKCIDLHVHTNFSDGFDSIEKVLKEAKENNVGVISLTEHYNVSSYKIATELAGADIEIIPGIEIGADMSKYPKTRKQHVCHILGYYISKDICKLLDMYEIDRYNCVVKTLELLKEQKIKIGIEDVIANSRDKKSIGRFDIARTLKKLGYTKSTSEAYGKYLDHGGNSYVKRQKLIPTELVKKIREYGGVPVLAHPKSIRLEKSEEEVFIKELVNAGLCGIETYTPNHKEMRKEEFLEYCRNYNLVPTVGSDYHGGKRQPVIEIGKGINNNLNITDKNVVSMLKQKKQEIDRLNQK